jgi:uncharacterized protein YcbK (DUF882 family)
LLHQNTLIGPSLMKFAGNFAQKIADWLFVNHECGKQVLVNDSTCAIKKACFWGTESIDTIYWIDGYYIGEAIREINLFMRDWRTGTAIQMDTRTVDIMAASHRLMDASKPYMLLSGYRSPETNAMLRSRSSGVATRSLHMVGQAADLRLEGHSTRQMARAAQACRGGGVGRYSGSNFVHMDCGPVRSWGG